MKKKAFLFGYGRDGRTLAQSLKAELIHTKIIEFSEENYHRAIEDGYDDTLYADVSKDEEFEHLDISEDDYVICVMDDEHLNVFLTLTLHAFFPRATIIAISDSIHASQKLKMAGASRVIDLYEVSANRIHNILKKPVATKLLDDFISRNDGITLREMKIPHNSFLDGMIVDEVDFQAFGVLLVGMIDLELGQKFIFVTSGTRHKLDSGDTLVCIGEKEDLKKFEAYMHRSEA